MLSYFYGLIITLVFLMLLPVPNFAADNGEIKAEDAMKDLTTLFPREVKGQFCTITLVQLESVRGGSVLTVTERGNRKTSVVIQPGLTRVFKKLVSEANHRTIKYAVVDQDMNPSYIEVVAAEDGTTHVTLTAGNHQPGYCRFTR